MSMRVETVSYDDSVATQLIEEMEIDLAQYYGVRHYPPQNLVEWSAPHGTMVVAFYETQPAGCGGFIRLDNTTAELKRMFVRMAYRRRGVASAVLASLEKTARELGYTKVVLETGVPQVGAQQFYLAAGYASMQCWPPHSLDPTSVCFGRDLLPEG
jgi:GNAT superfamily N-acetyltransferase